MAAQLLSGLAVGFATTPSALDATFALRWSADASGLTGGLSFAVEPDFCSKLMPQFEDRQYIYCSYLQSAMLRAFETWSMNHQDISFINVTDVCNIDEAVLACRTESGNSTDPQATTNGNCTKLCSRAQIFVLADHLHAADAIVSQGSQTVFPLPAKVGLWQSVNDTTETYITRTTAPRTTSGVFAGNQPKIGQATITFNRYHCKYLDSTFCRGMHEMQASGMSALVVFSLAVAPFLAIAIVGMILRLFAAVQAGRKSGSPCEGIFIITTPIWLMFALVAMAIVCPYVYFSIARPCVRCFDFEASFVQAVGTVLGLSDPSATSANYEFVQPLNSSNCADGAIKIPSASPLLRQVAFIKGTEVGNGPVMLTPQRTRVERCPSLDDLQGLNYLYPTCSLTRQSDPVCIESMQSLGALRFASVVMMGIVCSFLSIACCSCCSRGIVEENKKAAAGEEGEAENEEAEENDAKDADVKAAKVDKTNAAATYPAATSTTLSQPAKTAQAAAPAAAGPSSAMAAAPSAAGQGAPDASMHRI